MQFILKSDIIFDAKDLNDACLQLADHFKCIAGFKSLPTIDFEKGNIIVKPVIDKQIYSEASSKSLT